MLYFSYYKCPILLIIVQFIVQFKKMANPYKLSQEIEQFIISQKRLDPGLSCRSLMPLVEERFHVSLSKSLINNVFKQNNLSNPKGRKREKEPEVMVEPGVEPIKASSEEMIWQAIETIENGGFFFLKAANLKLSLTTNLARILASYFPETPQKSLQGIIEALIYLPYFRDKDTGSLSLLIGRKISGDDLERYSEKLAQIVLPDQENVLIKEGFIHNINHINDLYEQCLLRLNAYAQEIFFPAEYKSLGFSEMKDRFYSMVARIEKKHRVLKIRLLYPPGFSWANDIVWQEGFSYAAYRVNAAAVFTKEGEQIWMSSLPELLI
jgi:hypothetical protein